MNQQEIDQLFEQHCSFGTDLESCEAECMTKDDFTAAIQEAVAQARRQALEEAARHFDAKAQAITGTADRLMSQGNKKAAEEYRQYATDYLLTASLISALMAQEAGE